MLQCSNLVLESLDRGASGVLNAERCLAPTGAGFDGPTRRQWPERAGAPGASSQALRVGLEDLLGDLWHARRQGDMGRLALLLYCEVRRWARLAGEQALAQQASALMVEGPLTGREEFLAKVDRLIGELEAAHRRQV
ncbi:hypothetical protein [Ideonella sp. A 288]|uniref:hypothetical protein n=1 Tax=Ideonella sp. A 288 TaxID=1962181 RepID=UPI001184C6DC|nr:hypothetical protein [Ideonella sp. A 288]